jgi:hypothetical protein
MTHGEPAESDELAAQADRLEAALERIAACARGRPQGLASAALQAGPDSAELAARLDSTIARLRAAIGER